jgi:hypothetical protein
MAASSPTLRPGGPAGSAWLYGPATDLLIGCGGAYLLSVPILIGVAHATAGLGWSTAVATLLALFVSGPHYGATLVRVYREAADRRKYRWFAVHATLALLVAYVLGLHSFPVGSWLLTLYVSLSIWHFSGQNYGVALMLLRRRGVAIPWDAQRWFHVSFVTSFALSFLVIHMQGSSYVLAIGVDDPESYSIRRLGIPLLVVAPLAAAIGALHVASLAAAARRVRSARWRDLGPAMLIVLTQSVWYTVPGLLLASGGIALDALPFTAVWISVAHAVQYLWVTSYYAKRAAGADAPVRHLMRSLMAGVLATTVPALICAPGLLGGAPWDGGLALLTFSVLNLHHFLLDGAVWKLRDGRVARALLCTDAVGDARRAPRASGGAWIWALGTPCLALALFAIWEGAAARSDDPDRARSALDLLRWVGRDSASLRFVVGTRYANSGDTDRAIVQYDRSLALQPKAYVWAALSLVYDARLEWNEARVANDRALELDPGHTVALMHAADLAFRRAADFAPADATAERACAVGLIERALASHDASEDPRAQLLGLAGGLEQDGRADDARRIREVVASNMAPVAVDYRRAPVPHCRRKRRTDSRRSGTCRRQRPS